MNNKFRHIKHAGACFRVTSKWWHTVDLVETCTEHKLNITFYRNREAPRSIMLYVYINISKRVLSLTNNININVMIPSDHKHVIQDTVN